MTRLDTVDQAGALVCRTYQLGISRGVEVVGAPADAEAARRCRSRVNPLANAPLLDPRRRRVPRTCTPSARASGTRSTPTARVALAAGLPDIILHGTATMALAVTRLVDEYLGGDPTRVRRLGGRFSAMVLMPSTLRARGIDGETQRNVVLHRATRRTAKRR